MVKSMTTYYSDQPIDHSIIENSRHCMFLAGPTPRSNDVKSWRPDAIDVLERAKYDGVVFIPEFDTTNMPQWDYLHQVSWETWGLINAKVIVFWVPRVLETMPAFTTNVEFGRFIDSGRVIYGRPDDSVRNGYLDWLYEDVTGDKPHNNLDSLMLEATTR